MAWDLIKLRNFCYFAKIMACDYVKKKESLLEMLAKVFKDEMT